MSSSSLASLTLRQAVMRARRMDTQLDIDSPSPALAPPPIPIRPLPQRLYERKTVQPYQLDREEHISLTDNTPSRPGAVSQYNRASLETRPILSCRRTRRPLALNE